MLVSSTRTTRPTGGHSTEPSRFVGRGTQDTERRFVVIDDHAKAASQLSTLSAVASEITLERTSERIPETIEWVLEVAREELGMEVAFVSEFTQQRMVFRKLTGEAESFGWKEDESVPVDDTFCRLLLEGYIPERDFRRQGRRAGELPKRNRQGGHRLLRGCARQVLRRHSVRHVLRPEPLARTFARGAGCAVHKGARTPGGRADGARALPPAHGNDAHPRP